MALGQERTAAAARASRCAPPGDCRFAPEAEPVLSWDMAPPAHLTSVDLLAPGRDPARPRVVVDAFAVATKADIPPHVRLEITVDRGDGRLDRHALTLPADVVGLVGEAFVEVGATSRAATD